MKQTVCGVTPKMHLGDVAQNKAEIINAMRAGAALGVDTMLFPRGALCGATLGDIAGFQDIRESCIKAVNDIKRASQDLGVNVILGTVFDEKVYIKSGIIHKVFKTDHIVIDGVLYISVCDKAKALGYKELICDFKQISHAVPVVYVSAGYGESTTDIVANGVAIIAQGGKVLQETKGVYGENYGLIDGFSLISAQVEGTAWNGNLEPEVTCVPMNIKAPFLPQNAEDNHQYARDIFHIQVASLVRRGLHVGCKKLVVAVSGGLDSALALMVAKKAIALMGLAPSDLVALTMPCFGTSGRTLKNAQGLMAATGAECRTILIKDSVLQHFADIDHKADDYSVVYENAQARERTQIGLDIANKVGGIFVGTGDMSELMLGFTTFSGDHLSMYGVNGGLTKTMVRFVTQYVATQAEFSAESEFLLDILQTPISPELLPTTDGVISQKTENILGSYDVHDYGIYHLLHGRSAAAIYQAAKDIFPEYSIDIVKNTLNTLLKRFVTQQFKRSCLPDGVSVTDLSVSPRGGLVMPSDMLPIFNIE